MAADVFMREFVRNPRFMGLEVCWCYEDYAVEELLPRKLTASCVCFHWLL